MKREVSRDRNIPPFRIGLADLGVLIDRLSPQFAGGTFSPTITVYLKNEELQFESVDEITRFKGLPAQVTSFKLWIYGGDKSLSLGSGGLFRSSARVSASASNEAWCAGAVEVVWQFLQPYRVWYGTIRGWPLNLSALCAAYLPGMLTVAGLKFINLSPTLFTGWAITTLALGILFLGKKRLLPSTILRISNEENVVRRYMPELTLTIAVLSLVLTIVGWIVS